ncbi:uncharacterized protein E0L32_012226 [Thyridium curvatum]|uniref:Uncharacterized protein n=1 Tax=Thyridium curvatum TaxID=1093900 RepID=A0A507B4X1_9PEZI|nr:uncharacterized protein E0L32_012226 [Thyridium curvatum]TPX17312.1 hypothetical protein E0L32_012226 [Thyridium curvatum]
MLLSSIGPLALLFGLSAAGIYPPDVVDKLAEDGMVKLKEYMSMNPANGGCTLETAVKRKEWSDLSIEERKDYIQAVLCLQSRPAKTSARAPGAKSRFDDYVVVHIQQTPAVHGSVSPPSVIISSPYGNRCEINCPCRPISYLGIDTMSGTTRMPSERSVAIADTSL